MRHLSVGKKLGVAFGIIIVLLALIVVVTSWSLIRVGNGLRDFYNGAYQTVPAAKEVRILFEEAAKNMLRSCVATERKEVSDSFEQAQAGLNSVQAEIDVLQEKYTGNQDDIDTIVAALDTIDTHMQRLKTFCLVNKTEQAYGVYVKELLPAIETATDAIASIESNANTLANSVYASGEATSVGASALGIIMGVVSLAISVVMGVIISRMMTSPIREVERATVAMSRGDFNVSVNYRSKDELGQMTHAIRKMTDNIRTVLYDLSHVLAAMADGDFTAQIQEGQSYVGEFEEVKTSIEKLSQSMNYTLMKINQAAEQVAGGSDQIASGAQALSQGSTEQASSVEELAATISEISDQIARNAESASAARDKSLATGDQLTESNSEMKTLSDAINDISHKSDKIGKIIKTIEDIAFQTNILALNAAVEAARAGAAGKGFAVVADEVRNLASKSQEAAKSTTELIQATVEAVGRGTKLADKTAKSMLEVVNGAQQVIGFIDEIAQASNSQAESISQVTEGVSQISNVVQTNSATAEEAAAAGEELSSQAQILKSLVGNFEIHGAAPVYSDRPVGYGYGRESAAPQEYAPAGKYGQCGQTAAYTEPEPQYEAPAVMEVPEIDEAPEEEYLPEDVFVEEMPDGTDAENKSTEA